MKTQKPLLPGWRLTWALIALATLPVRADWTPEKCYMLLTNLVVVENPGVPLRNFRVIHATGSLGPNLTNRSAVLPLLHPGDFVRVKSTLSSTGATGPRNPHSIMEIPTGNNN